MKQSAVIVAGGSGVRMGAGIPKQFIELLGKPLFMYSIDAFLKSFEDIAIILVMPEAHIQYAKDLLSSFHYPLNKISIVKGGETRFHSVKNGLSFVDEESIVFVHDAVRCMVSTELIQACYDACTEFGSAIPAISVRDSLRVVQEDGNTSIIDRNKLRIIQTPQTFFASDLKKAFESNYLEFFTDEASVAENHGLKIHLILGEESNIKITFPEDLAYATWKLDKMN